MRYLKKKISKIDLRKHKREVTATNCYYIRLTRTYSLKLFDHIEDREETHFRQKIAHSLGIAPKIGSKINFKKKFGYITQHAEQLYVSQKELDKLKETISLIGWNTNDYGLDFNVGKVNGKPVIIDFDNETLNYG